MKRPYDSTVARIAGNIASGLVARGHYSSTEGLAHDAVRLARAIVAETINTEPAPPEAPPADVVHVDATP